MSMTTVFRVALVGCAFALGVAAPTAQAQGLRVVEGQTTAHVVAETLADCGIAIRGIAQGVPLGGELNHLDDGTLLAALKARRDVAI